MIERELKDITEGTLRELIAEGATEGKTLEFKSALDVIDPNAKQPDAKLKFLRSVASFANASGGDTIFGIAATNGKAESVVPVANFTPDADEIRLRDIIRANIEPRAIPVSFQPVPLAAGGHALVMRIRKSWAGAHFVTLNGDFKFYTRDHGGKRPMDVPEIRNAFTVSEGIGERINRFRLERTANILANETPHPILNGGRIVLHICPLSSFEPGARCNLDAAVKGNAAVRLKPLNANGWDSRYDVDGYYVYQPIRPQETATGYTLISHSGWIEAVESYWLRPPGKPKENVIPNQNPPEKIMWTRTIEKELMQYVVDSFSLLKLIEADAPVAVMLSFLNVRDFLVDFSERASFSARRITRDNLLIPGSLVETLDIEALDRTKPNVLDTMRPMFDMVWNACGLAKSHNFAPDGSWKNRQDVW